MPLRWLRRLRGGGKSAGSPAHPPNRAWPSNWLEGDAILGTPSAKAGELQRAKPLTIVKGFALYRTPKRPSEASPPCPRATVTPRGWTESHRLTVWSNTATRASSPLHERPTATCHFNTEGKKARPRVPAGSKPGVRASRVVQRPRARVTAPIDHPGAPSPGRESFLKPLPDSFFSYFDVKCKAKP